MINQGLITEGGGRLTGEDRGGTSIHVVTEFLACDFLGEGGGTCKITLHMRGGSGLIFILYNNQT